MIPKNYARVGNEQGFVLVLALVLLVLLTLFGVWAMQTSDFELKVAGNAQVDGSRFNVSEGANYATLARVGFSRTGDNSRCKWFIPNDLVKDNQILKVDEKDFNPGDRSTNAPRTGHKEKYDSKDENTWPWSNLGAKYELDGTVDKDHFKKETDSSLDYRYLVTYIGSQTASQGYDADTFTAYTYRIQGNMANQPIKDKDGKITKMASQPIVVETGGKKIGMKLGL